jgi:hypothetical protein
MIIQVKKIVLIFTIYILILFYRNFELDQTKEMLTKSIKWRIEFKADEILSETFPASIFEKVGFIHKRDKENRPVTYNHYGGLDNKQIFGELDRFLRWRVQLMEKGVQLLDFVNVDQMIQVHDYKLVAYSNYDSTVKTASKNVSQILQDNYPELLVYLFFIIMIFLPLFFLFNITDILIYVYRQRNSSLMYLGGEIWYLNLFQCSCLNKQKRNLS